MAGISSILRSSEKELSPLCGAATIEDAEGIRYRSLNGHVSWRDSKRNLNLRTAPREQCPTTRQLFAYVIDGYFYGTQGVSASSKADFAAFRTAVPNTNKYYTWDGTKAVAHERAYVFTTSTESLALRLAVPFYEGKTFKGWFIDSSCTSALSDDNITNRMTIYAKWE